MGGRYAVYYVPAPESLLYRLGSALLGRCVYEGQSLPRPDLPGLEDALLARHTGQAARYGFHGTIVAPFRTEAALEELYEAVDRLARGVKSFPLEKPALHAVNNSFAAIMPAAQPDELAALERHFVMGLSPCRLPLTEKDIARRGRLTPRQAANLSQWGYHLVFDDFKFHLTVSDSLPDDSVSFIAALGAYLEPALTGPILFDRVGLFYQPSENEAFMCQKVFMLPA